MVGQHLNVVLMDKHLLQVHKPHVDWLSELASFPQALLRAHLSALHTLHTSVWRDDVLCQVV